MSYTPNTWANGDVITAAKLNHIENGIAESYDLVILVDGNDNGHSWATFTTSDCTIITGNILDCEDKLDNDEPVNAIAIVNGYWSYTPSGSNTNKMADYLSLDFFEAPYKLLHFSGMFTSGTNNTGFNARGVTIGYDADTGLITSIATSNKTLSST